MAILDLVIRGPHNAKVHAKLDSSYQKTSKMTLYSIQLQFFLEKFGFPRWHLATILGMVIWGTQKAKLLAEMDSSYQKTTKTTYCTTFCSNYLQVSYLRCHLAAILDLCKFRELPKVVILLSGNQTRLVLEHLLSAKKQKKLHCTRHF